MKLAVVIINYNSSADLERCLESLAAYPPSVPHEIVIVDNASRDEGLAAVHGKYADLTWLFNTENTGYARGCNQGMAQVAADYYLVLNPDIVVQPGAMDRLLRFADDHPRAGMVGPQLLNEDGSVQTSCRRFYTFRTLLLRRTFLGRIFPDSETVRRHPFGSVACVGLVGYLVGRTKGASIMAGITAGLSSGIMRQLSDVFEGDFFDF